MNSMPMRCGPRVRASPLPGWPDGAADGAATALAQSAARGRELTALLDPENPVPGVTQAPLRPEIAAVAVPTTVGGRNMAGDDFAVTVGWGHYGQGDALLPALGETTFDIYLNGEAFWRNFPAAVWNYRLGGY